MKMTPRRCSLLFASTLLATLSATATATSKGNGLRGAQAGSVVVPPQVQTVAGHYFGMHFDDSPFAINPWSTPRSARVVDDLDPTAPFDRLDKNMLPSWSGAAQVAPGADQAAVGYTHPDFVPPYLYPHPFPKEHLKELRDGIMVPIGNRIVVAHEDRLRLPGLDNEVLNPLGMYPLTAPANKIPGGPWPVAQLDAVPANYGRFFDQTANREAARQELKDLQAAFKRVDKDDDMAISPTEYDAEIKGHQKKTDEQAQVLWKQYHESKDPDMSEAEFTKLAKTGFDLGQKFVKRDDISSTLTLSQASDRGFWGGGAACPNGKYIKGVQIKTKANGNEGDNTALNCVKFKCEDDSIIQTAEGPDGAWTGWAECPKGQAIYALSARVQAYRLAEDNSGINDLMFKCRSPGQEKETTLMFGPETPPQEKQTGYIFVNGKYIKKSETDVDDKLMVVGKGKVAKDGGWSEEMTCGTNGALCGAQGRLLDVKDAKDNMGITDIRFFCCAKKVDCAAPCAVPKDTSTECKACKAKA